VTGERSVERRDGGKERVALRSRGRWKKNNAKCKTQNAKPTARTCTAPASFAF
jgi:hypothetical protein